MSILKMYRSPVDVSPAELLLSEQRAFDEELARASSSDERCSLERIQLGISVIVSKMSDSERPEDYLDNIESTKTVVLPGLAIARTRLINWLDPQNLDDTLAARFHVIPEKLYPFQIDDHAYQSSREDAIYANGVLASHILDCARIDMVTSKPNEVLRSAVHLHRAASRLALNYGVNLAAVHRNALQ